jgi:hypothetical protein
VVPVTNFDNLANSILALFQMATMELWVDLMYSGVSAVAPEVQPVQHHNPVISLFFIAFLVVGAFLVLNLLVAITIEKVGVVPMSFTRLPVNVEKVGSSVVGRLQVHANTNGKATMFSVMIAHFPTFCHPLMRSLHA